MKIIKSKKFNSLPSHTLKSINGGDGGATLGAAILAMAIYEHGKHFLSGVFNPFTEN